LHYKRYYAGWFDYHRTLLLIGPTLQNWLSRIGPELGVARDKSVQLGNHIFAKFWNWLKSRRKPLKELLVVDFDDYEVRVRVVSQLEPGWNQSFEWTNIRRICFKDGGLIGSDIIYISLKHPDTVKAVLTEAKGGHEFFGALIARGLFPEHIWRKATGDTSGGMHCWPPAEDK
jgi:hypothetical protein